MRKKIIISLSVFLFLCAFTSVYAQEKKVSLLVRPIGDSTYFYKVVNNSEQAIKSFQIGFDKTRKGNEEELTMIPSDIESSDGWKGETVFLEESNLLHIRFHRLADKYAIKPNSSLEGFIVYMPEPYDLMKQTYFTVIYNGSTWNSGKVELDTTPPVLYDGKGQKHNDVNTFLSYLRPLQARTTLSDGKNYYYIFLFYGQTIMPETFKAELNGKDITNSFHPKAGESDSVKLNFKKGKNTLALIIDGKKSNGKRKTDIDRFVFIVQ